MGIEDAWRPEVDHFRDGRDPGTVDDRVASREQQIHPVDEPVRLNAGEFLRGLRERAVLFEAVEVYRTDAPDDLPAAFRELRQGGDEGIIDRLRALTSAEDRHYGRTRVQPEIFTRLSSGRSVLEDGGIARADDLACPEFQRLREDREDRLRAACVHPAGRACDAVRLHDEQGLSKEPRGERDGIRDVAPRDEDRVGIPRLDRLEDLPETRREVSDVTGVLSESLRETPWMFTKNGLVLLSGPRRYISCPVREART